MNPKSKSKVPCLVTRYDMTGTENEWVVVECEERMRNPNYLYRNFNKIINFSLKTIKASGIQPCVMKKKGNKRKERKPSSRNNGF